MSGADRVPEGSAGGAEGGPAAVAVQAWADLPAGKKLLRETSAGWFGLGTLLRFEELLGRGSQGQAWLCKDRRTGIKLVAKIMRRAVPDGPAEAEEKKVAGGRRGGAKNRSPKMKFSAKRLAGEILMQSSVNHRNVVSLVGVVLSPTHLAILQEPCLGGELSEYIKIAGVPRKAPAGTTGRVPPSLVRSGRLATTVVCEPPRMPVLCEDSARYFFVEILKGLESCHANHIAHRDLKFTNIVLGVGSPPEVKITDFGLAQHFFVVPPPAAAANSSRPRGSWKSSWGEAGAQGEKVPEVPEVPAEDSDEDLDRVFARCRTRVGTPNYVPREIAKRSLCRSGYNGCAADVWSLGVMLFAILTGKFPFPDLDGHLTLIKRLDSDLHTEMLEFMMTEAQLGTEVKDLIARMLHMDADARPSITEIREHEWVLQGLRLPNLPQGKENAIVRPPLAMGRRRRRWLTFTTVDETLAKAHENILRPIMRMVSKMEGHCAGTPEKGGPGDSALQRRRETSPEDEDEARFRSTQDFPEESWLQLREIIASAEEGPGRPREPLRLWVPTEGSFRLSRHREDGSVHDYRSDVQTSGTASTATSQKASPKAC